MSRIVCNPGVLGGSPCIAGTRIPPVCVFSFYHAGLSTADILEQYPNLTEADVDAAVEFCLANPQYVEAMQRW